MGAWPVPERFAGIDRWRALGRLLPRDVRERIFEPAFGDLVRSWLNTGRAASRLPFAMRAVGTYMGCVPIAIPRIFVRGGRLTRVGHATLWTAAVATAVVVVVLNLTGSYASPSG